MQNDPVNFVDPTGLEMDYLCENYGLCGGSGYGADVGWSGVSGRLSGGGFNMNEHQSTLNPSGQTIIARAEVHYNELVFRYLPIDEATVLPLDFQTFASWVGLVPQGPVERQPRLNPTKPKSKSDLDNEEKWRTCVKNAIGNQLGVHDAMVAVGLIPVSKSAAKLPITAGASEYTSVVSYVGHTLFRGANLPFRILGTNRIFGIAGRASPYIGAALIGYDVYKIGDQVSWCNASYNVHQAMEFVHP